MNRSKKIFVTAVVVLAILLLLATPAMAEKSLVCGGVEECRINIMYGIPTEYPAGEPFFIMHGNGNTPSIDLPVAAGHMGFALQVDGVYVEPDWVSRSASSAREGEGNAVFSIMAFNFPQGLPAGVHTFTGHWYVGCAPQWEGCEGYKPMAPYDYFVNTITVTFE